MNDASDSHPPRHISAAPSSHPSHQARATLGWAEITRLGAVARVGLSFLDALEAERVAGHITADIAARVFHTVVQSHDELQGAFRLARSILNKH